MNKPRKLALAVLASITIAGIAGASASSLGNLNSASIGSDDTVTASCDSDGINVSYGTTYNQTSGKNDVTSVTFSSVASACGGLSATVTLSDINKAPLSTKTQTVALTSGAFTVNLTTAADAELVENLALVIQG